VRPGEIGGEWNRGLDFERMGSILEKANFPRVG